MDSPSNIRTSAKACLRNMCDRAVSMMVRPSQSNTSFLRCSGPILGLLLTRRRFVTQKDSVAGGAPLQASAHALPLDPQAPLAKALLEFSIIPSRPDSHPPPPLQSPTSGRQ